ncbi:MAG: ABC transporter substrate-binding protein [Prevotellaceae bacterium]|nr:ABC transporter substrate-binding protein [Prevotellaceae bacterium]
MFVIFLFLLFACNSGSKKGGLPIGEVIYQPQYAQGFALYRQDRAVVLKVTNPWQYASGVELNYFLKRDAAPDVFNEIKIPVGKVVCMSTTHVAFISALEKTDCISGISGLRHVSDSMVIKLAGENKIVETGYDSNLSYELLYSLSPDVVFAYGVAGEFTAVEKKLNELGIKIVYIGEYLEDTPLGKAEWIVAMSAFFDEMATAEKIFETIKNSYSEVKAKVGNQEHKPLVMMNIPYKDVWYLPGTRNYMVKFIEDAGGKYIYETNNKRESYPMSIEKAFVLAQDADFWLMGNSPKSLDDLKNTDARMAEIPAFKQKKVYNSNLRANDFGDDFWESGIVKPDVVLKDLIKIFHPHLLPEHKLYYYRHLE